MSRPTLADLDSIPAVCFLDDVAYWLETSRRTVEKMRAARVFPIREMASIDKRPRWCGTDVRRFLEQGHRLPMRKAN